MIHNNYSFKKDQAKEFLLKGDYEQALRAYLSCNESLHPENNNPRERAILFVNSAVCLHKMANYSEALKFTTKALEADASYSKAYYRKALILKDNGELVEALKTATQLFQIEKNSETRMLLAEISQLIKKEQEDRSWNYIYLKSGLSSGLSLDTIKKTIGVLAIKFDAFPNRREAINNPEFLQEMFEFSLDFAQKNITEHHQVSIIDLCLQTLLLLLRDADGLLKFDVFIGEKPFKLLAKILMITASWWLDNRTLLGYLSSTLPYICISQAPEEAMGLIIFLLKHENSRKFFLEVSDYGLRNFLLHNLNANNIEAKDKDKIQAHMFIMWGEVESSSLELLESSSEVSHLHEVLTLIYKYLLTHGKKFEEMQTSPENSNSARYALRIYLALSVEGSGLLKSLEASKIYINLLDLFIKWHGSSEAVKFYCLESLAILAKDQEIIKEISGIPEAVEKVKELRILFARLSNTKDIFNRIKIALLLIKINSKEKEKDIQLFSELFSLAYIEAAVNKEGPSSSSDLVSLIELLSHLSCFDSFKLILVKKKNLLEKLQIILDPWLQTFTQSKEGIEKKSSRGSWEYQILNGYLNITMNLTLDQMKEFLEKQKKKFGVGEEELENLKMMHKKYAGEEIPDEAQKYNELVITQNDVRGFFCRSLKVKSVINCFLLRFSAELSDFSSLVIIKLLASLSTDKANRPFLFDTLTLKWVSNLTLNPKTPQETKNFCHQFISSQLASHNPKLLEYSLAINLTDTLILALEQSEHELVTFESLLALVQLSSLGNHIIIRIKEKRALNMVVNQLLEQNEFIIHAALELINNIICLDQSFESEMTQEKFSLLYQTLGALLQKYEEIIEESTEPLVGSQSFDDPIRIYSTILSIFAMMSYDKKNYAYLKSLDLFSSAAEKKLMIMKHLKRNHLTLDALDIYNKLILIWRNDQDSTLSNLKLPLKQFLEQTRATLTPQSQSLVIKLEDLIKSLK